MKFITLTLTSAALVSTALAINPLAIRINIAIQRPLEPIPGASATSDRSHQNTVLESGATDEQHDDFIDNAIINAHCESLGTDQTNPEIDIEEAISSLFDTNTKPAPWSSTASCSTSSDFALCTVEGNYVESSTCGAMCQGKIRIEARRVAKQNNSKVFCYYGASVASATATFDWVVYGSLVKSSMLEVEGRNGANAELK